MSLFRMNWVDYQKHRFVFKGIFYDLTKHFNRKVCLRSGIMLILNMRRDAWVPVDDILQFAYAEIDPDKWGDWQLSALRVTMIRLRLLLPRGVNLLSDYNGQYMLTVQEN